ncbi:sensor histidine kinase [Fulvivirga sedimenti]|uniref:histidine kinase n=1 Tax=Fulvivirga sedimenti TaxID=2879465 RepID=A0A9X1HQM6_9BACT|nr:HAMP domain-containing sensor histidine kinase [Fulvivirga sedimenti]MCA6074452.1 HAMP domain-containing histidine kinase [Fulvivirga sedimenti]
MSPTLAISNRMVLVLITLPAIFLISVVDYLTGSEMSFSIFYLIPLVWMASSRFASRSIIFIMSFIASVCWLYVDQATNEYSMSFLPYWNATVRLIIFAGFGWLLYANRLKQQDLQTANQRLSELNNEKNKFLGMAAHDLRNPIGGINGLSEIMMMKETTEDERSEILRMIKKLSENMLQLITNLLDVSKIESGNLELHKRFQDINQFLREQCEMNQLMANRKEIKINMIFEQEPIFTTFDANYLSQVVNNLLSNAIKYSQRGSLITIRVARIEEMRVRVEFEDQGRGIRAEEQKKLFNYFQRTSTIPTEGEQSTGLGLAIAKKIITEHLGTIGLKKSNESGSVFFFELPYGIDIQEVITSE